MDEPWILAHYCDDCWEPEEAHKTLNSMSPGRTGLVACLKLPDRDPKRAIMLTEEDFKEPVPSHPPKDAFIWVMYEGPAPTQSMLLDLYGNDPEDYT